LHVYRAIYDAPPDRLYAIHHTILVMAHSSFARFLSVADAHATDAEEQAASAAAQLAELFI